MWMTDYIDEIKRQFRAIGFKLENDVPDGIYPMGIEGKTDYVVIKNDIIFCCNYTKEEAKKKLGMAL